MGGGGPMRIATCANEAAGNSVKASNNASAIFFIMNHILLGLSFRGFLRVRVRSGLLMISTVFGENSCGPLQTAPAHFYYPWFAHGCTKLLRVMMEE
jgi:hypothetical protein